MGDSKIPVLDKGYVELQDMMGSDRTIVAAARVSYLQDSKGEQADKNLLEHLYKSGHGTPFEMAVFKFRVKTPEVVFRQWVRHRIGSFNVQSRRYTDVGEDDFYVPESWGENLHGAFERIKQDSLHIYKLAQNMGIPREQARLFLPGFAVYSTFIWTVNARSLMNFLKLRLSKGAQLEIRQYARAAWEIFEDKLPWTAESFAKKEWVKWD
jgi:thymidylate synthase (FAD)